MSVWDFYGQVAGQRNLHFKSKLGFATRGRTMSKCCFPHEAGLLHEHSCEVKLMHFRRAFYATLGTSLDEQAHCHPKEFAGALRMGATCKPKCCNAGLRLALLGGLRPFLHEPEALPSDWHVTGKPAGFMAGRRLMPSSMQLTPGWALHMSAKNTDDPAKSNVMMKQRRQ